MKTPTSVVRMVEARESAAREDVPKWPTITESIRVRSGSMTKAPSAGMAKDRMPRTELSTKGAVLRAASVSGTVPTSEVSGDGSGLLSPDWAGLKPVSTNSSANCFPQVVNSPVDSGFWRHRADLLFHYTVTPCDTCFYSAKLSPFSSQSLHRSTPFCPRLLTLYSHLEFALFTLRTYPAMAIPVSTIDLKVEGGR